MSEHTVLMGRFAEVARAADALEALRKLGVPDGEVEVIAGFPYSHEMLGRPHHKSILPKISLGSAVVGVLAGLFMTVVTPNLYVVKVGGQPVVPIPPTALLMFEFTMIFLILGTFLGFLWINLFPSFEPTYYDEKVSDGEIALVVQCESVPKEEVRALLEKQKAENIHEPERRAL